MRFWKPEPDVPDFLDWWLPLVRAGRRALIEAVPWLILVDEWALAGCVQRRRLPDVWVYVHHQSGPELFVDDSGQPYRFIPTKSGPSTGRFKEVSMRQAVWAAGLPHVGQGIRFEPAHPHAGLRLVR